MKTATALLYLIIVKPLEFLLKNRALLIIGIVAFVGFTAYNMMNCNNNQSDTRPEYAQNVPDVKIAPDVWITPSQHFYSVKYSEDETNIYLEDYFSYKDDEWERQKPDKPLQLSKRFVKHYTRSMQ